MFREDNAMTMNRIEEKRTMTSSSSSCRRRVSKIPNFSFVAASLSTRTNMIRHMAKCSAVVSCAGIIIRGGDEGEDGNNV